MDHEAAAKAAARAEARKLGDLGALGLTQDDLLQHARLGIWRAADIIAKLEDRARSSAMVRAGRSAIVDMLRRDHGRSTAVREARKAIRVEQPEPGEESDHWANDPQRLLEAMDAWHAAAAMPVRLQMLATLLGVGYQAKDIAEFIGVDESRVSQLRGRLGQLLEAMA